MKRGKLSKWQTLHELLGLLGQDKITLKTFWANMRQHDLTDDDIDAYCCGKRDDQG